MRVSVFPAHHEGDAVTAGVHAWGVVTDIEPGGWTGWPPDHARWVPTMYFVDVTDTDTPADAIGGVWYRCDEVCRCV